MPTNARKQHLIGTGGPWGSGLLCLGVATVAQGAAYMAADRHELRASLAWIDQAVPIAGWGVLWVAAGSYSIICALKPPQRHADLIPAVAVVSLWAAFALIYWLYSGLFQHVWTREWTAALAWGSLAAVLINFGRCNNPLTGRQGKWTGRSSA